MNVGVDLAPSGQRVAANDGFIDISNPDGQTVAVDIDITANAGGLGSLTVSIYAKDPLTGGRTLLLASAALAAVAKSSIQVGPGLPATANVSANAPAPKDLSIGFVHGAGGPIVYSARARLIGSH